MFSLNKESIFDLLFGDNSDKDSSEKKTKDSIDETDEDEFEDLMEDLDEYK